MIHVFARVYGLEKRPVWKRDRPCGNIAAGVDRPGHPKNSINFIGIIFLFMIMIYPSLRRDHCRNTRELIRAKSGEKNCSARKSRKREDSASSAKEIALRRTPKRLSRKRTSRPTLDLTRLSGEKDFLSIFTTDATEPAPPVRAGLLLL
jgi:hypothetical protein